MRTVAQIQVTPQGTLWVDIHLGPPALAIRRQDAGLVRITRAEIGDLLQTLALAGLELAALEAEAGDARTDEEKDADDRRDYLESLHAESPIANEAGEDE